MIDAKRWIIAEAWLSNGLRLRWGPTNPVYGDKSWFPDDGHGSYRYAGYGEWEVIGGSFTNAGYPRPEAPTMSTDTMLHELAHWLIATEDERAQVNFGLREDEAGRDNEHRTLLAERVLQSVLASASRIATMALGGQPK